MSLSISEAEKLLGLSGNYSSEDVQRAFKRFAKKNHPDFCVARGVDKEASNEKMRQALESRDLLVKNVAQKSASPSPKVSVKPAASGPIESEPEKKDEPVYEAAYKYKPKASTEKQPENTASETEKKKRVFADRVIDVVYGNSFEDFPLFLFLLVVGVVSPFVLFGGLNFFPSWHGLFVAGGIQFLIAYLVIPALVTVNALLPIHFLDEIIKFAVMLFFLPMKKIREKQLYGFSY